MHFHLEKYLERFFNLLGHGNRRYIQTLLVVARAFLQMLHKDNKDCLNPSDEFERHSIGKSPVDSSVAINDFLFLLNIDNINFVKVLDYINESNIIHKVFSCFMVYTLTHVSLFLLIKNWMDICLSGKWLWEQTG